jgi:hypothetical protein
MKRKLTRMFTWIVGVALSLALTAAPALAGFEWG